MSPVFFPAHSLYFWTDMIKTTKPSDPLSLLYWFPVFISCPKEPLLTLQLLCYYCSYPLVSQNILKTKANSINYIVSLLFLPNLPVELFWRIIKTDAPKKKTLVPFGWLTHFLFPLSSQLSIAGISDHLST